MKPHNLLNHRQAQELVHLAMDVSLDEAQRKLLDQHLESCADCRAYTAEMTQLNGRLQQSLQARWQQFNSDEGKSAYTLAGILPQVRKNQMKINRANTLRSLGWGALTLLLIAALAWTSKHSHHFPNRCLQY